jgi:hypothetical protein
VLSGKREKISVCRHGQPPSAASVSCGLVSPASASLYIGGGLEDNPGGAGGGQTERDKIRNNSAEPIQTLSHPLQNYIVNKSAKTEGSGKLHLFPHLMRRLGSRMSLCKFIMAGLHLGRAGREGSQLKRQF